MYISTNNERPSQGMDLDLHWIRDVFTKTRSKIEGC